MFAIPATNAVNERSFSALKRVKTYLRSTTGEGRLNHLVLLHVHKELADGIDMVEVANLFVGDSFQKADLPMVRLPMMTLTGETFAGFKIQR